MIVYAISINGAEKYIGITRCSLEKRWREHKCAAKCGNENPLYRAMRKHGFENCEIYQIASCFDPEGLFETEKRIIEDRGTLKDFGGYNVCRGGVGQFSFNPPKGEQNHNSRLTEEFVRYIRDPELFDVSNQELCDIAWADFDINVSRDSIRDARRGDTWTHIDVAPIKRGQGRPSKAGRIAHSKRAKANFSDAAVRIANGLKRRGKPNALNCKLSPCQVWRIAYGKESARSLGVEFNVDKATIMNVRNRKVVQYNEFLGAA